MASFRINTSRVASYPSIMALSKRTLLTKLTRDELQEVAECYHLPVEDRRVKLRLVEAINSASDLDIEDALSLLSRDRLKELCREFDIDDAGREKATLIDRLMEAGGENDSSAPSSGERASDDEAQGPSDGAEEVLEDYECEAGATIVDDEPEDREYQVQSLRELDDAFAEHRRVVLSLPTGAGKTFVAAKWLADNLTGRALWLTHRAELVKQAEDELRRVFGTNRAITRWTSAEKDDTGEVIVATVGCQVIPDGPFEILIVDEAHHRPAPSYKEWARRYRFEKELGLTATPERHDQVPLGYDHTVKRSFWDLVQQGYLAAPVHHVVRTREHYDLRKDRIRDDFEEASLRQLDNPKRNSIIVEQFLKCRDQYKKTLIFAVNVAHAENLVTLFSKTAPQVRVASILGTTDTSVRAKVVKDFEGGRIDVLINCKVFVEGFNCKDIETIFLTRPTMSAVLYCQMVGRGTRIVGAKRTFHLVEFQDQLSMFADKLAGFWDLGVAAPEVIRNASKSANQRPADPPLLLSPPQRLQWSTDLHSIGGVLAYWDEQGIAQGATLVYKDELEPIAAAVNAPAGIDRNALEHALGAGHWTTEEKAKFVEYIRSKLLFYLYDFRQVEKTPPAGAPPAVAAIHATVQEVTPLFKIEAFLGPTEKVDWGGTAADWHREFLSQQETVAAVLRIVDDFSGRVAPQKVFHVEATEVFAGLSEMQAARGLSGENLYSLQETVYTKHLKGTSITKYKWYCLAKSAVQGNPTVLDLRAS